MIPFFVGIKLGMTSLYNYDGNAYAVTIIKIVSAKITKILKFPTKKFSKIQVGFNLCLGDENKLSKPEVGVFLKKKTQVFKFLKEFKLKTNQDSIFEGMEFNIKFLTIGDLLTARAISIGKGNSGNIKKHNFKRGPMSHGSKHHRLQGSLGAGTSPGRVFPGKKMPGRLGGNFCTIFNLEILSIDYTNEIFYLKGSIPGKKKNIIYFSK